MSDESKRRRKERLKRERERDKLQQQRKAAKGKTPQTIAVEVSLSDRVAARFTRDQLDYFVKRSLLKVGNEPEPVGGGLFLYRTVYGEIALTYAKGENRIHVCYKDEVPPDVLDEYPGLESKYHLTEEE